MPETARMREMKRALEWQERITQGLLLGLAHLVTNPAVQWFRLRFGEDELNESQSVKGGSPQHG